MNNNNGNNNGINPQIKAPQLVLDDDDDDYDEEGIVIGEREGDEVEQSELNQINN